MKGLEPSHLAAPDPKSVFGHFHIIIKLFIFFQNSVFNALTENTVLSYIFYKLHTFSIFVVKTVVKKWILYKNYISTLARPIYLNIFIFLTLK